MKKKFIAIAEVKHSFGKHVRFVFESSSRANSFQNLCDAMNTWHEHHSESVDVFNTYLAKDCDEPAGVILS